MELPGTLNGHTAGIVMKEMVRRAIFSIRAQFHTFEAKEKIGLNNREDFVTTADRAAQEIYLRSLRECFPGYGVIAEEDSLSLPCEIPGEELFFTVDPLDGTKAFMRRQSHAIGTMIALVRGKQVIGAFLGDVMTHEIYGFRPGSNVVRRITDYNASVPLELGAARLKDMDVSLRNEPRSYADSVQRVASGTRFGGAFRSMQVSGGSIGVDVARLWKGEIGAIVMGAFFNTAWDYCPVMGISSKLGFVEVEIRDGAPVQVEPQFEPGGARREAECFLIHQSHVPELIDAFNR